MRSILVCFFLFLCVGCGYQFHDDLSQEFAQTVAVPYVDGDIDGDLTNAIIRELSTSGVYEYRSTTAQWVLQVKIIDTYDENIGFRYDRNHKNKLKHEIIPVETRQYLLVEVAVLNGYTGCIVRGPTHIQANVEFDHEYYTIRHGINTFSLGQLSDYDSAQDVAVTRLNKNLAEKIVDYLIYGW